MGLHRDRTRAGRTKLLARCDDRQVLLRREPDAIGNVLWIIREFGMTTVSPGGGAIEGEDAVATLLARTIQALENAGAMVPKSLTDGIGWRQAAARVPGLNAVEAD